jgi:hypothetical protein
VLAARNREFMTRSGSYLAKVTVLLGVQKNPLPPTTPSKCGYIFPHRYYIRIDPTGGFILGSVVTGVLASMDSMLLVPAIDIV